MENFGLNIYNFVKELIGEVPLEMEFLYAIGTIILLVVVFLMVYLPFSYLLGRR